MSEWKRRSGGGGDGKEGTRTRRNVPEGGKVGRRKKKKKGEEGYCGKEGRRVAGERGGEGRGKGVNKGRRERKKE